jgi:outer membrane protein assembly factor BamB
MNGREPRHVNLDDVPVPIRREIERLRQAQPPHGLLAAVVQEASITPQRRSWRGHAVFALGGAFATVAAGLLVALAVLPGLIRPGPGTTAGASVLPPAGSVHVRVPIAPGTVPGSADDLGLWVGNAASGRVLRLDSTTGATIGEIQVSPATTEAYELIPVRDGETVWAAGVDDRSLVRVDVASMRVTARWPIDAVAYRILPTGDAIWITDYDDGRVLRIDPDDGTVLNSIEIVRPTGIASVGTRIWVVDYVGDLYELDPGTASVAERFDVAGRASDVVAFDDDLLIWGLRGRALERFDLATRSVSASLADVSGAAVLDGAAWAATSGNVVRLDPVGLVPVARVQLGDVTTDQVTAGPGQVWVYTEDAAGAALVLIDPSP